MLQPAAEKAGLGRVTWHQFRHIHSSLLNDLSVPVKIAQEQLGHASISTTLNIYTHVVEASHRKAVEAVEERLFGEMDCFGPKSLTAVDQPQPTSADEIGTTNTPAAANERRRDHEAKNVSVGRTTASAQRDGESKGAPERS